MIAVLNKLMAKNQTRKIRCEILEFIVIESKIHAIIKNEKGQLTNAPIEMLIIDEFKQVKCEGE